MLRGWRDLLSCSDWDLYATLCQPNRGGSQSVYAGIWATVKVIDSRALFRMGIGFYMELY